MAGFHSTGRATRAAAVATPISVAVSAKTPSIAQVSDLSASICPEQPIFRLPLRPVRAPVTAPFRHSGPELAQCMGELIAGLRRSLPLRREEAAWRAWITPDYWHVLERGKRVPSIAVFIMLARSLGLDPRELLDKLLEKMHYGRGVPPVFQPGDPRIQDGNQGSPAAWYD